MKQEIPIPDHTQKTEPDSAQPHLAEELHKPDPTEPNELTKPPRQADCSLPAPTPFNSDASRPLQWKHWIGSIGWVPSKSMQLLHAWQKKMIRFREPRCCTALASTTNLQYTPRQHKIFADVKTALDGYFVPKRNVVAEPYKFRSRAQRADEPIDTYPPKP